MPSSYRKQRDAERRDRTRQALLKAAKSLFCAKGYHQTLISEIVKEADVGQGSFYRFFEDKRACFVALMEDYLAQLLDGFSDMNANLPRSFEEYRRSTEKALERVVAQVLAERELTLLVLRDAPTVDGEMADALEALYAHFVGLARHYLEHAVAKGIARPCRVEWVPEFVIGMAQRLVKQWAQGSLPEADLPDAIKEALDFAFMGLRPTEHKP